MTAKASSNRSLEGNAIIHERRLQTHPMEEMAS
eukprot:CAMPEP_0172853960 /NCGR_PEP_ID=MMETSP1075-20121228/57462_1 /TAXON_ID=2916 /ORGANISM="Ceratium fusus, Strain PA161109" /LENGTH=32 /DNA_ID= /DNA_START= /DNA_END= /DNA_ORIENTATION=